MSGVTVATISAPTSSGPSPRWAISRRTASALMVEVVSPGRADPALADAGAGDDPVVGGVEPGGELGVGDPALGHVARDAGDRGARRARAG